MTSPGLSQAPCAAVDITARAARAVARCRELATHTDVPRETTRTFLSPATRGAQALVTRWMEEAGFAVTIDRVGNLHASRPEIAAGTQRLLVGSHLDTVVNAGAFDGPLGVLLGVELAELFHAQGARPGGYALELVAFSEEEGVRFRKPFLGSLALIGESVSETVTDVDGISISEAIRAYGHGPTAPSQLAPEVFAYLEFHIEQGPVLDLLGRPLAAVSAIAGQTRMRVHFTGESNHAGTTPMPARRDALAAAAAWITAVEAHARSTPGLVATVGSLEVSPGVGNVIAGEVVASLDVRHAEDAVRDTACEALMSAARSEGARRNVACSMHPLLDQPATPLDPKLTALLVAAARSAGYDASTMASGAGHDAMILARRVPACMLFVRTQGGLSHHPAETVRVEDVAAALSTGMAFLRSLATHPECSHA